MKYTELIQKMYEEAIELDCVAPESKLEFAGNHIFDFTTYSSDLDVFFAKQMIEVLEAIVTKRQFEYHGQSEQHMVNYITMCNMPFLRDKLEWGTSIRGAWLDKFQQEYTINGYNIPGNQIETFCKDLIEWLK